MKVVNSELLNRIRTGFKSLFMAASAGYEPFWKKVAMEVKSTSSDMKYGWLGKLTSVREWLGDRVIQNLKEHSFSIKNRSFENTVGVDRDSIEDDQLGVYSPLIADLGASAAEFPDKLIADLMKSGFTTVCYDGQYFFDTDHPVVDENNVIQSVSNSGGGAGSPWMLLCTTRPVKPFIFQNRKDFEFVALDNPDDPNVFSRKEFLYGVDGRCNAGFGLWQLAFGSKQALTAENYQAARSAMMSLKGDNGRPMNIVPNLLVVAPANEGAARKILMAEKNDAGATNVYQNTAELLVLPLLA